MCIYIYICIHNISKDMKHLNVVLEICHSFWLFSNFSARRGPFLLGPGPGVLDLMELILMTTETHRW